jgi:hypothetical protein
MVWKTSSGIDEFTIRQPVGVVRGHHALQLSMIKALAPANCYHLRHIYIKPSPRRL